MGRSRWRNQSSQIPPFVKPRLRMPAPSHLKATIKIDEIKAKCPAMERSGLDGFITVALRDLENLLYDMREGVPVPNGIWNEETAVQRYLVYLSMLVDITLSDNVMSGIHSVDLAVLMKQRMMVEYTAKAIYCDAHPDYALWFTTVGEAESVASKLRAGGSDSAEVAAAEAEITERRNRFPAVAHMKKVPLSEMMREQTRGGDPHRNDEYVWLYGAPSALMHGDPESMRQLLPVNPDGTQRAEIALEDGYLNALLVDTGSNALHFCKIFRTVPSGQRGISKTSRQS